MTPKVIVSYDDTANDRDAVALFERALEELFGARDAFEHHWQMASFRRMSREDYLALYDSNRRLFEEKWGQVSV